MIINNIESLNFGAGVCHKKTRILLFIAAFVISASKIAAGIHWPADIAAGAIIGIASAVLTRQIFQKRF